MQKSKRICSNRGKETPVRVNWVFHICLAENKNASKIPIINGLTSNNITTKTIFVHRTLQNCATEGSLVNAIWYYGHFLKCGKIRRVDAWTRPLHVKWFLQYSLAELILSLISCTIRQHTVTKKHLFLYPQGGRSCLRKLKK